MNIKTYEKSNCKMSLIVRNLSNEIIDFFVNAEVMMMILRSLNKKNPLKKLSKMASYHPNICILRYGKWR